MGSKHLTDASTVYDEIISFLNEFQSPICMDLSMEIAFLDEKSKFDANGMCHPFPIGDVYDGYPLLMKLDAPNDDIAEITIHGFINEKNVKKQIEINVALDDHDDEHKSDEFPMELALA